MDIYDEAVEYFKQHTNEILTAWEAPHLHPHGCLFSYCSRSGKSENKQFGCLIQVKTKRAVAQTQMLTNFIRKDPHIPSSEYDIDSYNLEVFAKWRRLINRKLNQNDNESKLENLKTKTPPNPLRRKRKS